MKQTHKKHRHWLCAPLLCSLLGMSMYPIVTTQAELAAAAVPVQTTIELATEILEPKVITASQTFYVPTYATFTLGDYTLTVLDGLLDVTTGATKITVAAVTGSVYVQDAYGAVLHIPNGFQWTTNSVRLPESSAPVATQLEARKIEPIPKNFIVQLQKTLRAELSAYKPEVPQTSLTLYYVKPILFTDRAQQVANFGTVVQMLEGLTQAIATHNTRKQSVILSRLSTQSIPKEGEQYVLYWLQKAELPLAIKATVLSKVLQQNSELQQAAAVHNDYAAMYWGVLELPGQNNEYALLRFLEVFTQGSLTTEVVHIWKHIVENTIVSSSFLQKALLPVASAIVQPKFQITHPHSAQTIADTVVQIYNSHIVVLTDSQRQMLQNLQSIERIPLPALLSESEENEPAEEVLVDDSFVGVLSASEAEALARQILREAGAMFTVNSSFEPAGINQVQVSNVLFAGKTEDRMYSFVLDVKRGEVQSIHDVTTKYPNAMWVEDFIQWAKR